MLRVDCGKKVIRKNNWLPICNHLNVNLIRYDIFHAFRGLFLIEFAISERHFSFLSFFSCIEL